MTRRLLSKGRAALPRLGAPEFLLRVAGRDFDARRNNALLRVPGERDPSVHHIKVSMRDLVEWIDRHGEEGILTRSEQRKRAFAVLPEAARVADGREDDAVVASFPFANQHVVALDHGEVVQEIFRHGVRLEEVRLVRNEQCSLAMQWKEGRLHPQCVLFAQLFGFLDELHDIFHLVGIFVRRVRLREQLKNTPRRRR